MIDHRWLIWPMLPPNRKTSRRFVRNSDDTSSVPKSAVSWIVIPKLFYWIFVSDSLQITSTMTPFLSIAYAPYAVFRKTGYCAIWQDFFSSNNLVSSSTELKRRAEDAEACHLISQSVDPVSNGVCSMFLLAHVSSFSLG
jgi:hypothetical protein